MSHCRYPAHLYVVSYGDLAKIGVTINVPGRFRQYAREAHDEGVQFTPRWYTGMHVEACDTEQEVANLFRVRGNRCEYLLADWPDVVREAQARPRTASIPIARPRTPFPQYERWGWEGLDRDRLLKQVGNDT